MRIVADGLGENILANDKQHDVLKAAREALANVSCSDDGVFLSLTAHTKRGQRWLDRSTGMHYGAAAAGSKR